MDVVAVTDQCQRYWRAGTGQALTIRNKTSSASAIYLSEVQFQTSAAPPGHDIGPGSTLVWDAGKDLWIGCATGGTADVVLNPNSGALFDAQATAVALIDAGLADAIATSINVQGVPTVDRPTLLGEVSVVADGALHSYIIANVQQYQSLIMQVHAEETVAGAPVNWGYGWIQQYSAWGGGHMYDQQAFSHLGDRNNPALLAAQSEFVCPATGHTAVVQAAWLGVGDTVNYRLWGSYRPVDRHHWYNGHGYWGTSGAGARYGSWGRDGLNYWRFSPNFPGATFYLEYPNTLAGPAQLRFRTQFALGAQFDLFISDFQASTIGGGSMAAGFGPGAQTWDLYLPSRPVVLYARNAGGAATPGQIEIALLQDIR